MKRGRESFLDKIAAGRENVRMPRRPRLAAGDLAYHVINRRVGRLPLFGKSADYAAFEKVLTEAHDRDKQWGHL